jgi:hypothetical protein
MKVEGDIYDDTLQLHVIDLILKDVGTAGYTEYDWGTTLAEYFEGNEDKWPVMFFSIHSHHTMGVGPSGVDDKHLYDNISNFPFHLSVIVNNKLDFNARIATDMVINTVSYRGMDSNYTKKEVNDGRIIVEYSLSVSICATDISEFEEEFNTIQASKVKAPVQTYSNKGKFRQYEIPYVGNKNNSIVLNKYSLGNINYKYTTVLEALSKIVTEENVEEYLDEVEQLCLDYLDGPESSKVKDTLFSLLNYVEEIFPAHPQIKNITYGLASIHSLIDGMDDFEDVSFGTKTPAKDISRMTDKEWQNYVLNQ